MQPAHADAVADLRAAFPDHEVWAEELDDGSVRVTLVDAEVGLGWNREASDLSVKLMPTFPDTEPYPFYAPAGLQRVEGQQYSQIQPGVMVDGGELTQISLRTTRALLDVEGLGSRFAAIIRWLRDPK